MKSYNVNCPHPDEGDQILLGTDTEDNNQTLEDAASYALGIMSDAWFKFDQEDYDRASYSITNRNLK